MNRRSFLKTVTGIIAGLFTLPSLAKEKPKLTVQKAKEKLRGSDTYLVLEPETYNWVNKGIQIERRYGVEEWHCCYTRKDGRRMCLAVLVEIGDIEAVKKNMIEKRKAIKGGAWYPTDKTKYWLS